MYILYLRCLMLNADMTMTVSPSAIQCEPLSIFSSKRATQRMPLLYTHISTNTQTQAARLIYFADIIIFTIDSSHSHTRSVNTFHEYREIRVYFLFLSNGNDLVTETVTIRLCVVSLHFHGLFANLKSMHRS